VVVSVVVVVVDGVIVVVDIEDPPRRADRKFSGTPAVDTIFGLLVVEEGVDDRPRVADIAATGSTKAVSPRSDVGVVDFFFDGCLELEPECLFRFEERAICSRKHRISTLIVRRQTKWFEN
jgi:hypothetical protein